MDRRFRQQSLNSSLISGLEALPIVVDVELALARLSWTGSPARCGCPNSV
jgi:hypothetical protein